MNYLRPVIIALLALVALSLTAAFGAIEGPGGKVSFDASARPTGPAEVRTLQPGHEVSPPTASALVSAPQGFDLDSPVRGGTPGTDLATVPDIGIESVIVPDERVQITNTAMPPWRWITRLEMSTDNGGFICSGFFVGPQVLTTAGHCLFNSAFGGDNWANSVRVIPGKNGASEPFGSQTVPTSSLNSVSGWVTFGDASFDYGWIELPDETLHDQVGSFGVAVFSDLELSGSTVNLAGYPGDKPAGTMWFDADAITDVGSHQFSYEIDTAGGQSGSPVWSFDGTHRQVVGIHTLGVGSSGCNPGDNCGTRIRDPIATNLESAGGYDNTVDPGVVTCNTLTTNVSPADTGSVGHAPPNSGGCATDSTSPMYAPSTVVDLTATPEMDHLWNSWSGTDNNSINPTTRTMDVSRSITAFFVSTATPTPTLTPTATVTPTATATPTPTPTGTDSDGDSLGLGDPLWFRDSIELFVGTDPFSPCPADNTRDNELDDRMPADLNDDQAINILDRARIVLNLLVSNQGVDNDGDGLIDEDPVTGDGIDNDGDGLTDEDPGYDIRLDLNADGLLNIQDRATEVLYVLNFQPLGGVCTGL